MKMYLNWNKYQPSIFEPYWRNYWNKNSTFTFNIDDDRPKKYILDMFPYPSGPGLHVGHPRGYTATDVISRMYRLLNFNVLHPIGFDAFGLPAEQYAKQTNKHPHLFTQKNIKNFTKQLQSFNFDYDYSYIIDTTNPMYFKWTQWIFKKLYGLNLATLQKQKVNYCEALHTVLANEEIYLKNDLPFSKRGDFLVTKKILNQWSLKITKYADQLLVGLDQLDWPESIKKLQRNWIGQHTGFEFDLLLNHTCLTVFVTNLNNVTKTTKILLSIDHPQLDEFLIQLNLDKRIMFNNFIAKNLTACEFNSGISIDDVQKIKLMSSLKVPGINHLVDVYLCAHLFSHNISEKVRLVADLNNDEKSPSFNINSLKSKAVTLYKMQDWLFSRQRYWGEPFPVYFQKNQIKLVSDDDLPVTLPPDYQNYSGSDHVTSVKSPLAHYQDWTNVVDDHKQIIGTRDTNTMPQWAGSCWYYIAYLLKDVKKNVYLPLDSKKAQQYIDRFLPVDLYIGGQEHAVLHLLYARFWHLVLYDLKLTTCKEPFQKLVNQGMILTSDNEKMSKSKGDVVNPDDLIAKYGADALRLYEMFLGPINSNLPWNSNGVKASYKFLTRFYNLFANHIQTIVVAPNKIAESFNKAYHQLVKNVTFNIKKLKFNNAISNFMVYINMCYKNEVFLLNHLEGLLTMFSCFCPCLAEQLWFSLGKRHSIYASKKPIWPKYNDKFLVADQVPVIIQLNGKLKNKFSVLVAEINQVELIKQSAKLLKITSYQNVVFKNLKNQVIINFIT